MKEEIVFRCEMPFRDALEVKAFTFGEGEKSLAVVGAFRGNEIQQMYCAAKLVKRLSKLEQKGLIKEGHKISVIPCINSISMNVGRRFWSVDNTDINRMFPGYDQGETTQRIAAGVFEYLRGYHYGIQFTSFYREGDFVPHARYMDVVGNHGNEADLFGLPYVVMYEPEPFDTTTLNYNWRLWDTDAYSIYTSSTDSVDDESATAAVRACIRFMDAQGLVDYPMHPGYIPTHFNEGELTLIHNQHGGIFNRIAKPGDIVSGGEILAEIINPLTGAVVEEIKTPRGGVVFFTNRKPMITEHTLVFRIIPRGMATM